ncbi:hypothetical protein C8Q77DRAFT_1156669 [Trametes polyzona]|nr:hypothetical protein C8Q77DRAFT_1156669 [Trametes polyzona]
MLPHFVARVFPRAYASVASPTAALRTANARQRVVARTFLTTTSVAEPAKKSGATEDSPKTTKKRRTSAEVAAAKAAKAAEKAKAQKAKEKAKAAAAKAAQKAPLTPRRMKKEDRPPKAPSSAYNLFVSEQYKKLLGDIKPTTSEDRKRVFGEIAAQVSNGWKSLSDAEKKAYQDQADTLKEEYARAKEEWYKNTSGRVIFALRRSGRALPQKPASLRRPPPPFIRFHLEHFKSIEVPADLPARERAMYATKRLGEMWKQASDEEKARLNEEYQKELKEYQQKIKDEQAVASTA